MEKLFLGGGRRQTSVQPFPNVYRTCNVKRPSLPIDFVKSVIQPLDLELFIFADWFLAFLEYSMDRTFT